jgi:hypothetical protein
VSVRFQGLGGSGFVIQGSGVQSFQAFVCDGSAEARQDCCMSLTDPTLWVVVPLMVCHDISSSVTWVVY